MKIIISPAKKMNVDTDTLCCEGKPCCLEETEKLMHFLRGLSFDEAQKLWQCNDNLARLNYERLLDMDLYGSLTPAILSYEGIQYRHIAPAVFSREELDYISEHLRILSGFYGVLKPFDGVTPYRLEMQAKARVAGCEDLYAFWGDRLYREVIDDSRVIVNLASKEYAKCVERYLSEGDTFITCVFGALKGGRILQKGTQAKIARGEMVRYMAENAVRDVSELKDFDRQGYQFSRDYSSESEYVFLTDEE